MYSNIEVLNTDREFDSLQKKQLGHYIYALKDPRDNKIFYIGKGTGDRVFSHMKEAEDLVNGKTTYSSKRARIIDMWSEGEEVEWLILAHNLPPESVDYVESAIIDALEVSPNGQCSNVVRGPKSSLLTSGEVKRLGAAPVTHELKINMLFIFHCNKAIETSSNSIYECTRAAWRVNEKYLSQQSYAIGVRNGISIGGFRIESWETDGEKHAFKGVEEPKLVNLDWKRIINSAIGFWQRGNYLIVELNGNGQFKFVHGCSDRTWKELA